MIRNVKSYRQLQLFCQCFTERRNAQSCMASIMHTRHIKRLNQRPYTVIDCVIASRQSMKCTRVPRVRLERESSTIRIHVRGPCRCRIIDYLRRLFLVFLLHWSRAHNNSSNNNNNNSYNKSTTSFVLATQF